MRKSRFTQEQIIGMSKEHHAGLLAGDLCRKHGIIDAACVTSASTSPVLELYPGPKHHRNMEE